MFSIKEEYDVQDSEICLLFFIKIFLENGDTFTRYKHNLLL